MNNFIKELAIRSKEENKKNMEDGRNKAKKMIDEAKEGYIVLTESGAAMVGNKLSCMSMICAFLLQSLEEGALTEDDIETIFEEVNKQPQAPEDSFENMLKKIFER